jgi:hypothetical protein
MPSYGATPAGFVTKPTSAILADMQQNVWDNIDNTLDLSAQTPDGQMLAIYANELGSLWELAQIAYNQYNREDVEGAGLDNLGDIIGVPREGQSYTQVYCNITISAADAPYAAGALVANVEGLPAQTFSNLAEVTSAMISGGVALGILFQSTVIGPTPAVNPGTLTGIAGAVTGWTAVTNPDGQSQLGQAEETDAAYGPRQESEVAAEGSCTGAATAAALIALGASQLPTPVSLSVTVLQNTSEVTQTVQGIVMPPHTFAPVIWDGGSGWAADNPSLIAATIYANQPAGISTIGSSSGTVLDPNLGLQTVNWTLPTPVPLYVTTTVVPRAGITFSQLQQAIQAAFVTASVAPTPATGIPPYGQLAPGAPAIASQEQAVVLAVPGVFDVQSIYIGTSPSPVTTTPVTVPASQVLTITSAESLTNVVVVQGAYP